MTGDHIDLKNSCGSNLSDIQVAGEVRMLMRDDLNHEAVCIMARDRIMYLSQEVERQKGNVEHWQDVAEEAAVLQTKYEACTYVYAELEKFRGAKPVELTLDIMAELGFEVEEFSVRSAAHHTFEDGSVVLFSQDVDNYFYLCVKEELTGKPIQTVQQLDRVLQSVYGISLSKIKEKENGS